VYKHAGFWITGINSSVTATINSPKVVLITFRCRTVFFSVCDPTTNLFAPRLVGIGIRPFGLVASCESTLGKLRAMPIEVWETLDSWQEKFEF
jgi:hypothetical protein